MRLWRKLRYLSRRHRFDEDLAAEMRLHVELRARRLEKEGLEPGTARVAARRQFGNALAIHQASRDIWCWRWLQDLMQDLRFSVRALKQHPGFAVTAALTLSLGIGAATAVFSAVYAVLLQPLPYKDPHHVVVIWDKARRDREGQTVASFDDFEAYRGGARLIEGVSIAGLSRPILAVGDSRRRYLAGIISPWTFDFLGAPALLGNPRVTGGEGCAVVLSHRFWTSALSADPAIVGKVLRLDRSSCVVQAIMPHEFSFYPKRADMWFFLGHDPAGRQQVPYGAIFARIRPGVTLSQAKAELCAIHESLHAGDAHGKDRDADTDDAQRELTYLASPTLRSTLVILFWAVAALLLVACLNVAGLLLARFIYRQKEFAIRSALGCGRGRLIRQTLVESGLLALVGAVVGTCMAVAVVRLLVRNNVTELPDGVTVSLSTPVLVFAALTGGGAAILSALAPALFALKADICSSLGGAGRGLMGAPRSLAISQASIAVQIAACFVALTGGMLLADSAIHIANDSLGFSTAAITATHLSLTREVDRIRFQDGLLARLRSLPGVTDAAFGTFFPPYREDVMEQLEVRGVQSTGSYDVLSCAASAGFLSLLHTRLLRGRMFNDRDLPTGEPVALVSESLVKTHFAGLDPLGKEIRVNQFSGPSPWMKIVGVVEDWKHLEWDAEWADSRLVFRPLAQSSDLDFAVGVRAEHALPRLARAIQEDVRALHPSMPGEAVESLDDRLETMRAYPRFRALVVNFFALAALAIAAVGLHGVLSQIVSRRTPELGLRRAVGAQASDLLWLVGRQGGGPVLAGLAMGGMAAPVVAWVLRNLFWGVPLASPGAIGLSAVWLLMVAGIAIALPARRALSIDPMAALREE